MRKLIAILALALPLASPAEAQLRPERPLPGLPELLDPADPPNSEQQGEQQTPDQQPPEQQPPGQQPPDAQPPQDQAPPGAQPQPPQGPGQAPQAQRPQRQGNNGRPVPRQPETDEQLLTKLSQAKERRDARAIERELRARWSHSQSPTADLLMRRTDQALRAKDTDTARNLVRILTGIEPSFAEAWHRRATIAIQKEDYAEALDSLRRVLKLQPKHYVAIAELAEILEQFGDKEMALKAYRQAKVLDPFIDGLDDRIRALTKEVDGQEV
jgi:tetratricopeptide (TPR) repeat protein